MTCPLKSKSGLNKAIAFPYIGTIKAEIATGFLKRIQVARVSATSSSFRFGKSRFKIGYRAGRSSRRQMLCACKIVP